MEGPNYYLLLAPIAVALVYKFYRRLTRISLAKIPGPKVSSFFLGAYFAVASFNRC